MNGNDSCVPAQAGRDERRAVDRRAARDERIADYIGEALAQPDALRANVALVNAHLLQYAHTLDEEIRDGAATAPPVPLNRVRKVLPALQTQLQLTPEIDRFAQLDIQLADRRPPRRRRHESEDFDI